MGTRLWFPDRAGDYAGAVLQRRHLHLDAATDSGGMGLGAIDRGAGPASDQVVQCLRLHQLDGLEPDHRWLVPVDVGVGHYRRHPVSAVRIDLDRRRRLDPKLRRRHRDLQPYESGQRLRLGLLARLRHSRRQPVLDEWQQFLHLQLRRRGAAAVPGVGPGVPESQYLKPEQSPRRGQFGLQRDRLVLPQRQFERRERLLCQGPYRGQRIRVGLWFAC